MKKLAPAVSYTGDKSSLAKQIVDIISPDADNIFYDLCCGTGAISLELVRRGYDPTRIRMVDRGPWGLFWKLVGENRFSIDKFCITCLQIPKKSEERIKFFKDLISRPAYLDTPYTFLLLQAANPSPVWIDVDYSWKPNKRRSRVFPEPMELCSRVALICEKMKGVKGLMADLYSVEFEENAIIYIDPPNGLANYGCTLDIIRYVNYIKKSCFVSDKKPLSDMAYLLNNRIKHKRIHEEWLSLL